MWHGDHVRVRKGTTERPISRMPPHFLPEGFDADRCCYRTWLDGAVAEQLVSCLSQQEGQATGTGPYKYVAYLPDVWNWDLGWLYVQGLAVALVLVRIL